MSANPFFYLRPLSHHGRIELCNHRPQSLHFLLPLPEPLVNILCSTELVSCPSPFLFLSWRFFSHETLLHLHPTGRGEEPGSEQDEEGVMESRALLWSLFWFCSCLASHLTGTQRSQCCHLLPSLFCWRLGDCLLQALSDPPQQHPEREEEKEEAA